MRRALGLCYRLFPERGIITREPALTFPMKIAAILIGVLVLVSIGVGFYAIHAEGNAPAVGTQAPDFTLNSQDSLPVSLHDFRGKWVVLYFYPKDFTSGCTIEAHNFQRDLARYEKKDAMILGVSVQDSASHQKFCEKEGLNFKLLADTKTAVSSTYGSLMNFGVAKLSARHTFLIDPRGVIRNVFLEVKPQQHSKEVLDALVRAQAGSPM